MARKELDAPELYINRELSWLEFNDRVLGEGRREDVPLLERLKFLAIVSSNLDEFFMIRVAGLKQKAAAGIRRRGPAGMAPAAQLKAIAARAARMVDDQSRAIADATAALVAAGLHLLTIDRVAAPQQKYLADLFAAEIQPVLTPLAVEDLDPLPLLPGLKLHLAVRLEAGGPDERDGGAEKIVVVPLPTALPRFIAVPPAEAPGKETSRLNLVRIEEVIAANIDKIMPGCTVLATAPFRMTRDADVAVDDEEEAEDLLAAMEEAVRQRGRRAVIRLEIPADCDKRLRERLMALFDVRKRDVFAVDGMLDATGLFEVAGRPGFDELKYPDWPPQTPRDLVGSDDLLATVGERDVLLFHPYESFEPVVRLVSQAADDPAVLAIKMVLYRTSGDSPIVAALARAAENGKQVTVLVELKARFDESKNVHWARRLEDAGCYVIYGIAGYKTHAKALLIIRRDAQRIRRTVHLATGNYNDKTARLYSDIGLITGDPLMTADAAAFFNLLTGYSQTVGWNKFAIAPTDLRPRMLEMIDREIAVGTRENPGLIMAKVNSLEDRKIIRALYAASRAGVRVRLNVRGICCLRPGVKGVSDNIEVVSIVDRYLEHARIFYFRNGGHEEVYLSSADWMVRNLDKRLEILFPVQQADLRRRLIDALNTFFADNVKARRLRSDGTYEPVTADGRAVRAQQALYEQAVEAANAPHQAPMQFRPMARPGE